MQLGRTLARYAVLAVVVIIVPLLLGASTGNSSRSNDALSNQVHASENSPEVTQIASVWEHTARNRSIRTHREKAAERQEARASGWSMNRILEVAVHPMFLLVLAVPFFRKSKVKRTP